MQIGIHYLQKPGFPAGKKVYGSVKQGLLKGNKCGLYWRARE